MQDAKTDEQGRLIHDISSGEDNCCALTKIECEYTQEADCCSPLGNCPNTIELSTEAEQYIVIKTERWAIDNIDEFIELLKDFKSRFTFNHEITENKQ